MKKSMYLMLILLFLCCYSKKKETSETKEHNSSDTLKILQTEESTVVVTLDGMDYHSPVKCSYFGEDYFYFKSDKLETTDTNGDGIVITGHQQDDKMIFKLIVEGKTYSAANLGIRKEGGTAIGAGKLFAGSDSFNTTYKVICR